MKRCVIVSAAQIKNYKKIRSYIHDDDFVIYCDAGLRHQKKLRRNPDLVTGDFDSYLGPLKTKAEIIRLPAEKDDTDTFFAVKEALRRGYDDFLLIGVIGNRLDHSLCNISALLYLEENNKSAKIIDDYGEMEILGAEKKYISSEYAYFSLMNVCGDADGLYIRNAKYPLENGAIKASYQYGISNEVLPGKTAEVFVNQGKMLLVKIW